MKNIVTIFIIVVSTLFLVVALITMSVILANTHKEVTDNTQTTLPKTYSLTTKVIGIDKNKDLVTCEDCNGNLWEFYGVEDWQINDCASLLMSNSNTMDIYDDIVQHAYYNSWKIYN